MLFDRLTPMRDPKQFKEALWPLLLIANRVSTSCFP
jgi:hypothetical protein